MEIVASGEIDRIGKWCDSYNIKLRPYKTFFLLYSINNMPIALKAVVPDVMIQGNS